MRVGVDTGGTFTDVVAADGRIVKVLSDPADPAQSVIAGLAALEASSAAPRPSFLAHGTTVATNALLERRGAAVALVTTAGLGDVIEIARQDRPSLYDAFADRPDPLVPRSMRVEVGGRLDATGTEIEAVDPGAVPCRSSPSGGCRSRGVWRAASPAPWGRTGCSQQATRRVRSAWPTSARSACGPVTCSGWPLQVGGGLAEAGQEDDSDRPGSRQLDQARALLRTPSR